MADTYSFLNVIATIIGPGGGFPLGATAGVAEEGITIEMIEEKDTLKFGADGTPMHALNAAQGAKLKLRLLKTSPTNALLGAMYNLQSTNSANWGQNTIVVSDIVMGDVISCQSVAFAKFPAITYSKDPRMNEWEFNVGQVDQLLGAGA